MWGRVVNLQQRDEGVGIILKKEICRRCHEFNERSWGVEDENEWSEGMVFCPFDHFKTTKCVGNGANKKLPREFQNLFYNIFGWIEIDSDPPEWCEFKEDHI